MTRLFFRLLLTCLLFAIAAQRSALAQGFEEKAYLADLSLYNQLPLDSLWYYQPGTGLMAANSAKMPVVDAQFLRDRAGRPLAWTGVGWFRKQWRVPPGFRNRAVALRMGQFGASEIYLDGRLVQRYGTIGKTLAEEEIYLPRQPFIVQLDGQETHWLTVHYANRRATLPGYGNTFSGFRLLASAPVYRENVAVEFLPMLFSISLAFMMLFGFIYVLYPARLASVFSALGLANASCLFFALYLLNTLSEGAILIPAVYVRDIAICIGEAFLLLVTYLLFYRQLPRRAWLVIAWIAITPVLIVSKLLAGDIIFAMSGLLTIERLRMLILGVRKQKNGFLILLVGYVLGQALLFGAALDVFNWFPVFTYTLGVLLLLNGMIPPLTLALHLAWEFRTANRDLQYKLEQVETLSAEKQQILATQNEVLETQVTERTAELQHKNRELGIEAALDKVRSRSLAMHKSDELQEVVIVVFEKLKELGLVFDGGAGIQLFTEGSKNSTLWVAAPGQITSPSRINLPYDADGFRDNPIILDVWTAKETGEAIYNKTYTRDEKNRYFEYVFKHNDLIQVPPVVRDEIMQAPNYTQAFVTEKNSGVIANSWSNEVFPPDKFDVFKRIAKVFDQAYTRFLDLQKAEAQAREAQIEVALERVRSRTMAMQKSHDLADCTQLLFHQIQALELPFLTCAFSFIEESLGIQRGWIVSPDGTLIPNFIDFPLTGDEVLDQRYESWKQKNPLHITALQGDANKGHHRFLASKVPSSFSDEIIAHIPDRIIFYSANFSQGWILILATEFLKAEEEQILIRFSKVFEQTYTRFLDLQKAEVQAELAQQNLILIQNEKQRAEEALKELKVTQTQLIQKEKLASLGELTAGIAHEIQNPLNFVNNFSEVSTELVGELKEGPFQKLPDAEKDYAEEILGDLTQNLQKITHHGGRASAIVKGMLEHSRTSTGEKQPTDLNALADEYLKLAYHGLRAKDSRFNAELKTDFAPNLPLVSVVSQDMGRVLLNLINNGFYATQQRVKQEQPGYQPMVTVSTRFLNADPPNSPEGATSLTRPTGLGNGHDVIEIRIRDNGIGMSEATQAKVFQPFFTTKPTGEGTGLGLSLAYDIVTKGHGGTIEVESTEGVGSEFIIALPFKTNG